RSIKLSFFTPRRSPMRRAAAAMADASCSPKSDAPATAVAAPMSLRRLACRRVARPASSAAATTPESRQYDRRGFDSSHTEDEDSRFRVRLSGVDITFLQTESLVLRTWSLAMEFAKVRKGRRSKRRRSLSSSLTWPTAPSPLRRQRLGDHFIRVFHA